jgi:hypothetical protein
LLPVNAPAQRRIFRVTEVVGIEAREYKLLLDPAAFPGAASEEQAKAFWSDELKPLIRKLGSKSDGESRAEGELKLAKQRLVLFLDAEKRPFADRDFALRARTDVVDGALSSKPSELTLKFRSPDLLLAAEYYRTAKPQNRRTKLEEDIAPLQVAANGGVAIPKKRSSFSRFSVSTKVETDAPIRTVADAFRQFAMLDAGLVMGGQHPLAGSLKLNAGRTICEWVFQKAQVDLGTIDAEFALTLWYIFDEPMSEALWQRAASGKVEPSAAEISFDFDTPGGQMDAQTAIRASTLFEAMQISLRVNTKETSKTALGLPGGA